MLSGRHEPVSMPRQRHEPGACMIYTQAEKPDRQHMDVDVAGLVFMIGMSWVEMLHAISTAILPHL